MPLMTSRSGESLRPLINVIRTATLSMNHTPRLSRNWCGLQTNACKMTTISSCAILRSPGSHRVYTSCGKSAMKASLVTPGWSIQTIQKPPVPCPGHYRAASDAPTNRRHGGGKMKNWRFGLSRSIASMTSKLFKIRVVRTMPFSYCLSLMGARPWAPIRP